MYEPTNDNLIQDIRACETDRDQYLTLVPLMLDAYLGPAYTNQKSRVWEHPENHGFEWMSVVFPRLVQDNPRCRVESPGLDAQAEQALVLAMNKRVKDDRFRAKMLLVAQDMQLCFGATRVAPRKYGDAWLPCIERIPPQRMIWDPQSMTWEDAHWIGHQWVRSFESIRQEAKDDPSSGWNLTVLEDAKNNRGDDKVWRDAHNAKGGPDRDDIVGYDVWWPDEYGDGPGTIYTVIKSNPGKVWARKPQRAWGPRLGRYTVFGVYPAHNFAWPLSPLMATWAQAEDLNATVKAAQRSMRKYKKLVLIGTGGSGGPTTDPKKQRSSYAAKIRDAGDAFVIETPGLTKDQVIEVELGGITPQMVEQISILRDRLDRNAGMSSARRGQAQSSTTATADTIAAEAGELRMAFVTKQFLDGACRTLDIMAWDLTNDDRAHMALGSDARKKLGANRPHYVGGTMGEVGELRISIEPYSMERTNQTTLQQNWTMGLQTVSQMVPLMVNFPGAEWGKLFEGFGNIHNMPEITEWAESLRSAANQAGPPGAMPGMQQPPMPGRPQMAGPMAGQATVGAQRGGR